MRNELSILAILCEFTGVCVLGVLVILLCLYVGGLCALSACGL